MAESDTVFAGSIPQFYDQKLGGLLFAPFAADMALRLQSLTSGRLLETAAGTGIVTRYLATQLPPSVEIIATDLNQPMLDYAASQPGLHRVKWQPADAQALPFPENSFDVVVCQFGAMFFPDRVKGYSEARRVLKPGGRFLFNVWDRIDTSPVMAAAVEAMAQRYPQQTSWFLERTPCGYHDRKRIAADLTAAGFGDPHTTVVTQVGKLASALEAAIGLCQGTPMRAEIEALDKDGLDAATHAAAGVIAARCGKGPGGTPIQAIVAEATK